MSMYDMFYQAMGWGLSNRVDDWLTDRVKEMRAREAMPYEKGSRAPHPMANPITDEEKIVALVEEVTALRAHAELRDRDRIRESIDWASGWTRGQSWLAKYIRRVLRGEE